MDTRDFTYLKWAHARSSSGTAGTFLKSESVINGKKVYYKLSNFDNVHGVVGHECVNELIVDRLLTLLGVEHVSYELIHAEIEVEHRVFTTYLCASEDFKQPGESKIALDDYYRTHADPGESHYEFCVRNGWQDAIDTMLVVDYLICNRDRHGANIEILRNAKTKSLRLAPLFDHGLSLLYSCNTDEEIRQFDVMKDYPCQSFIGSRSTYENLSFVAPGKKVFENELKVADRAFLLEGLDSILTNTHLENIWQMIYGRYEEYEKLSHHR